MSLRLLKKLADKKYREETGLFLVEGKKGIEELLGSDFHVSTIYTTLTYLDHFEHLATEYEKRTHRALPQVVCVTEERLSSSGTFQSNNAGAAIAKQRARMSEEVLLKEADTNLVLVLDDIRDPGNLGTIMRTADWFGIRHIVTSPTTTDPYNPKVIAASMGSFARVSVTPCILPDFLQDAQIRNLPILGAFLEGKNVLTEKIVPKGILVMGSESHGIQNDTARYITEQVTIPRYGKAESLNVAVATAVILSALRR